VIRPPRNGCLAVMGFALGVTACGPRGFYGPGAPTSVHAGGPDLLTEASAWEVETEALIVELGSVDTDAVVTVSTPGSTIEEGIASARWQARLILLSHPTHPSPFEGELNAFIYLEGDDPPSLRTATFQGWGTPEVQADIAYEATGTTGEVRIDGERYLTW